MTTALVWLLVALGRAGPPSCDPGDLRCIELLPTAAAPGASGRVDLFPAHSPFGAAVDAEGRHRYDLALRIEGLPPPGDGGPFEVYVAWAATPLLEPVISLGEVRNGESRAGPVALNQFLVLVTAELAADVERPTGPAILRGTSPSMALQFHELPAMLSVAAGGGEGGHHGHEESGGNGWRPPPEHPTVRMPPGLHPDAPDVDPFLPADDPETLPEARSGEILRLVNGDSLGLVAAPVRKTIGGRARTLYGFNGRIPGPLIRVPQGATITVGFTNRTPFPTAIHWHGIRLDNAFDGVPHLTQEPVPSGGSFRYVVRFPDAGIYWYHPHHREDVLQDLGLSGNLRVDPPDPGYWSPVDREEVLVLDDLLIGDDLIAYGREAPTHAMMGRFGNVLLVNGEPEYGLALSRGEVVRFFLTNVSSTRTFNLSFGAARTKLVASDAGKFEREEWVDSVVMAPAERYVVEVLFEESGAVALTNRVQAIDHLAGRYFAEVDTLGSVLVSERPSTGGPADSFDRLRRNADAVRDIDPFRRHFDRPVDQELVLTMEADSLPFPLGLLFRTERAYFNPVEWSDTMPLMNWVTTGRRIRWILRDPATGKENDEIDWGFREGDIVKIRLTNPADALHTMQHPIHVHGQRFLVLEQEGVPNDNLVWKDTLLLPAGGTATILLDLSNPGQWMLHCHIAEHLEAGMRTVFEVEPDGASEDDVPADDDETHGH